MFHRDISSPCSRESTFQGNRNIFFVWGTISCLSSTEMESVGSLGAAPARTLAVVGEGLTCVQKAQSRLIVTQLACHSAKYCECCEGFELSYHSIYF